MQGQVALVTGGASGIGQACAERFSGEGAEVIVADVSDSAGTAVAARIGARYEHLDVADRTGWSALVERIAADHGRLDLLHLNAGIRLGASDLARLDLDDYLRLVGINQHGVIFGLTAALGLLARSGGSVIVTGSRASISPLPHDIPYAMAKHAVAGLVRSAAGGLADQGIRINAICPATVDTGLLAGGRRQLEAAGVEVMEPAEVADGVMAILASGVSGACFVQLPGRAPEPFEFAETPR